MSDYDEGMKVRREVLGDEHVDRATVNEVTEDFQELITRYAWGGIWTRPGLPRRDRSIITITALVAGRHFDELEFHLEPPSATASPATRSSKCSCRPPSTAASPPPTPPSPSPTASSPADPAHLAVAGDR